MCHDPNTNHTTHLLFSYVVIFCDHVMVFRIKYSTSLLLCVCVQFCHLEHYDGNFYIKYAMGDKTGAFNILQNRSLATVCIHVVYCVFFFLGCCDVCRVFQAVVMFMVCVFQAGFTLGIIIIVLMGLLTLYCCYRVLKSTKSIRTLIKHLTHTGFLGFKVYLVNNNGDWLVLYYI